MYYIIDCEEPENEHGEALIEIHNCFRVGQIRNWRGGRRFRTVASMPPVIDIPFTPLRGYRGSPVEFRDVCIPIMTERLAFALQSAGVDNIDYFPARLTNTLTGETYAYRAFNIVGVVAAADLGSSEWTSPDGRAVADTSFTELVLDETRIRDMLMFRLAENINAVLVHESVRNHVLNARIDTLTFTQPEEWVHL